MVGQIQFIGGGIDWHTGGETDGGSRVFLGTCASIGSIGFGTAPSQLDVEGLVSPTWGRLQTT